MFSAAHLRMCEPTGVEPVKAILAMRLLVARASPASLPKPWTTLSTPGGSRSPMSSAARRCPAGSARPAEHHAVAGGQRRGQLPGGHQQREVPRDDLPDHAQGLVDVVGHGAVVDLGSGAFLGADAAGEVAEVVGGQGMSALRVSRTALPLSQVSVTASSSRFCSMRSAIFSRMFERSCTEVRPQASAAAWAASRALSMSSAVERGTRRSAGRSPARCW